MTKLEGVRKKEGQEFVGSDLSALLQGFPGIKPKLGCICLSIPKCPRILFGLKKTKDVGRVFFTVFCVELSETSNVRS